MGMFSPEYSRFLEDCRFRFILITGNGTCPTTQQSQNC
jgi:hypothetical protein